MKGYPACMALAMWMIASCRGPLPSSSTTTVASSTLPVTVDPSRIVAETKDATQAPPLTDTPRPTPEGLLRLTDDLGRDDYPAWSGDAGRIAFYSDRTGVDEIFAMNAAGGQLIQLTDDASIHFKEDPAWSPDSRQIAFSALDDLFRIFVFDVQRAETQPFKPGEALVQRGPELVSDYYADSFGPAWSPDGRRISLTADDVYGDQQVFTLDLVSRDSFQVTHGPSHVFMPNWSSDGRRIAFASDADGDLEIYVIGADGSGLSRLTDNSAEDGKPSWSPDGRFIVFSSDRNGPTGLYVMREDGSDVIRLDTGVGKAFTPSWSPDGRYIAFVSDRDGNAEIYRIDAPVLAP